MNGIKRKRGRPTLHTSSGPIMSSEVTIPLERWIAYGAMYIADRQDTSRRVFYHSEAMRDAALKNFRKVIDAG